MTICKQINIFASTLARKVLPEELSNSLICALKAKPREFAVLQAAVEGLANSELKRSLNLAKPVPDDHISLDFTVQGTQVLYQGQAIGETRIWFKSTLPGELQARLAIASAIDRFLEYLEKVHYIVVLDESDRHIQVFIPGQLSADLVTLWQKFINEVAFSAYGLPKYQLPGLIQTFVVMLNSVTLSGRGFSTLEVPILNSEQAKILASLYFAVWRDTKKRQDERSKKINDLRQEVQLLQQQLADSDLTEKDLKSKQKELNSKLKQLNDAEEMQKKEAEKYQQDFQKIFGKFLQEQHDLHTELEAINQKFSQSGLSKTDVKKLEKRKEKLHKDLILSRSSLEEKQALFQEAQGNPFHFVELDQQKHPEKFKDIVTISRSFTKTATDQINGTRGDIFTQCLSEMYRLMELEQFEPPPLPLLLEQPTIPQQRSPGDDNKEFCYACGVALEMARWQVLRFVFERPSQRRQSASGEGRPHICSSCAALAFASPLKVTDESIILRLEPTEHRAEARVKLKDYLRMLTNKEMHLNAGKYIVLASDKTQGGDSAAQKLGQVQYAFAKVASIFPREVLADFHVLLMAQSCEPIPLAKRHLIIIKGLMESYGQSIIEGGKEINVTLGDAIRYVQQDLPYLAEYTLTKTANISNHLEMEKVRLFYWQMIQTDLVSQGDSMDSNTQLAKRARLYRDVAALTGLTLAFATSLESTAQKAMDKKEDAEREVSKLIEKVDDPIAFCYYATLGDETKKSVQARLWWNSDNEFVYTQLRDLLSKIGISNREEQGEDGKVWLNLYADDVLRAYTYFAEQTDYSQEKDWNHLTYQVRLSLYTRFPELVRKLKTKGDK